MMQIQKNDDEKLIKLSTNNEILQKNSLCETSYRQEKAGGQKLRKIY